MRRFFVVYFTLDNAALMELQPPNLNVRLEPRNNLGWVVLGGCVLVALASAFINPGFAIVFSACAIVSLPVLWLFPPKTFRLPYWGGFEKVAVYALLLGYIALAKAFLVPFIIGLLERAYV